MRDFVALQCLSGKHRNAQTGAYAEQMAKVDPVVTIADNVRRFMQARGDSQAALAQRAGVSQRAIGDLMTYGRGHFKNPTVRTVDAIAAAYSVAPWALLLPNFPSDPAVLQSVSTLLGNYLDLETGDRETVDRLVSAMGRGTGGRAVKQRSAG